MFIAIIVGINFVVFGLSQVWFWAILIANKKVWAVIIYTGIIWLRKILQNITEEIYPSHEIAQTRMKCFSIMYRINLFLTSLLFFLFFSLFVDFFEGVHIHMQDWGTSSQPG